MAIDGTPVRNSPRWLPIGAVLTAESIVLLWPLQHSGEICAAIYPAPPGCVAPQPRIATVTAIAVIIAAMVAVAVTVQRPRLSLWILAGTIPLVALLAVAIVALSQTGIWDPSPQLLLVN